MVEGGGHHLKLGSALWVILKEGTLPLNLLHLSFHGYQINFCHERGNAEKDKLLTDGVPLPKNYK